MAVKEKKVFPENPSQWDIPANKLDEVKNRFNQINQLLEEKKHFKYPEVFSKMLLGYDCWVEPVEKLPQHAVVTNLHSLACISER